MDTIIVQGGKSLAGAIAVSGAKNAALPILISSLFTAEPCTYQGVPHLADIRTTLKLLSGLGDQSDNQRWLEGADDLTLCAKHITNFEAPYDLVKTMRASFLVLGPLVARFGTGAGFDAGRLRDRRAADQSALEGARSPRRNDRTNPWLCRSQGKETARRENLSRSAFRRRNGKSDDGGGSCRRHDDH